MPRRLVGHFNKAGALKPLLPLRVVGCAFACLLISWAAAWLHHAVHLVPEERILYELRPLVVRYRKFRRQRFALTRQRSEQQLAPHVCEREWFLGQLPPLQTSAILQSLDSCDLKALRLACRQARLCVSSLTQRLVLTNAGLKRFQTLPLSAIYPALEEACFHHDVDSSCLQRFLEADGLSGLPCVHTLDFSRCKLPLSPHCWRQLLQALPGSITTLRLPAELLPSVELRRGVVVAKADGACLAYNLSRALQCLAFAHPQVLVDLHGAAVSLGSARQYLALSRCSCLMSLELDLQQMQTSPVPRWELLGRLHQLRHLSLLLPAHCSSGHLLPALARLQCLESLALGNGTLASEQLQELACLHHLTGLKASALHLTGDIQPCLPTIKHLSVTQQITQGTNSAYSLVRVFPSLASLALHQPCAANGFRLLTPGCGKNGCVVLSRLQLNELTHVSEVLDAVRMVKPHSPRLSALWLKSCSLTGSDDETMELLLAAVLGDITELVIESSHGLLVRKMADLAQRMNKLRLVRLVNMCECCVADVRRLLMKLGRGVSKLCIEGCVGISYSGLQLLRPLAMHKGIALHWYPHAGQSQPIL